MRFPWQKERELSPLEQLVARCPSSKRSTTTTTLSREADPNRERDMHELALDGVAHHVFNTLRGANDVVEIFDYPANSDHAFDDVREDRRGGVPCLSIGSVAPSWPS
jgi:hypothetical protein